MLWLNVVCTVHFSAFKDLSMWDAHVIFRLQMLMHHTDDSCESEALTKSHVNHTFSISDQSSRFVAQQRSLVIVHVPPTQRNDFHQSIREIRKREKIIVMVEISEKSSTVNVWKSEFTSKGADEGSYASCIVNTNEWR